MFEKPFYFDVETQRKNLGMELKYRQNLNYGPSNNAKNVQAISVKYTSGSHHKSREWYIGKIRALMSTWK